MKYALPLFLLTIATSALQAQLVRYPFTSGNPAPSTIASNASATDFTIFTVPADRSGFSSASSVAFMFVNATASTEAAALDGPSYFTFTVDAEPGYQLDLTSISFNFGAYVSTGDSGYDYDVYLQSSADGFGSSQSVIFTGGNTIASGTQTNNSGSISLAAAEYQGLSSVTFRFMYSDSSDSATISNVRIGNVILNGDVTAIPEPAQYAAAIGAIALIGLLLKRRR